MKTVHSYVRIEAGSNCRWRPRPLRMGLQRFNHCHKAVTRHHSEAKLPLSRAWQGQCCIGSQWVSPARPRLRGAECGLVTLASVLQWWMASPAGNVDQSNDEALLYIVVWRFSCQS